MILRGHGVTMAELLDSEDDGPYDPRRWVADAPREMPSVPVVLPPLPQPTIFASLVRLALDLTRPRQTR